MPFKSKAQMRLFYAAMNKKGGVGKLSQETAKKFIEDSDHQSMKDLPNKIGKRFSKLTKILGDKK